MTQIGRLLAAPVGIWFLTHLREKTNKEGELVVYAPDMDKAVHGYVMGAVDFVWLAEVVQGGRRVVHTQPTPHFEAGSRKSLPSPLPMDASEIARALDRALNPQDYDENGDRKKPEVAPEPVAATPEVEAPQLPPEPKDVQQTGDSDVPTTLKEAAPIGKARAADLILNADSAAIPRDDLRKAVQHATGSTWNEDAFDDDELVISVVSAFLPAQQQRIATWVERKRAKATA